ncbi:hypothetical protein J7337_011359 [Fusarium musae]|uniref:G domain-containing protein n=1 Tax=Fusarium musae TaxID=1042133 RepID=A0A9P8IKY6_9HYPO|nr:hypothetical protein J7337_011359 [Fusarium musae]KAG9496583.1 hypothetical protein J7337_011359 [Fusarium musae]
MDPEKLRSCKVILVIGPAGAGKTSLLKLLTGEDLQVGHRLDHGTALPTVIHGTINDQSFVFIDSPGFGHSSSQPGEIEKQIHAMLGHFTRELGGIHGILYVQDIPLERELTGMQEATNFLRELAGRNFRSHITFITTKWDAVAPKVIRKCETKEEDLIRSRWASFRVGDEGGSRLVRHGIDCSEDDFETQQAGRQALLNNVMAYYVDTSIQRLTMPFSQLTYGEQGFKIATVTGQIIKVTGKVALAVGVLYVFGAAIASGVIVVSFSIRLY